MSLSKPKTILIDVEDQQRFKDFWSELCNSMGEDQQTQWGFKVYALSNNNEFAKLEELEHQMECDQ